jgi:hypothetical protein
MARAPPFVREINFLSRTALARARPPPRAAVASVAAAIRNRRESALIKISERVKHAILRPLPAELGGVAFASHYQSATSAALVGGDLHDVAMTQFGAVLLLAQPVEE